MSSVRDLVRSMFSPPGHADGKHTGLLDRAAVAHAELLSQASSCEKLTKALAPIAAFLKGSSSAEKKRRLLCHPLFIEGLHSLSPFSCELQRWHDRVTSSSNHALMEPSATASMGNIALAALLASDRKWCGRCELCTDFLGRLGFPFCDWTMILRTQLGEPLSCRAVTVTLDHDRASWRLVNQPDHLFLVMPRFECIHMLLDNATDIDGTRLRYPDPEIRMKLSCACRLGRCSVRYDPVSFQLGTDHAAATGGIIESIVLAMRRDSPDIYREFRTYIRTVRGFEFPRASSVASFSDPTTPGVMSVSVSYTDADEPCLDPFCFTWFGHEMGHTKDYLCDTILYSLGESLATNSCEWSEPITRYGRRLSVRTLIQIPYVHLYEWELLMDFYESSFAGLPWHIAGGAAALGNDLEAEIEESFELIHTWAKLTPTGIVAMSYFHDLFDQSRARWHGLKVIA